ncbi:MAG: hypothetical protein ACRD18_11580 [Terriglobia bacterium]
MPYSSPLTQTGCFGDGQACCFLAEKLLYNLIDHREAPYRLLRCNAELSAGDPDTGNLLIQGGHE